MRKLLSLILVGFLCFMNPAIAANKSPETYYWVHVPSSGIPVFIGETEGPFVKDEYPISREASAKILRVEGGDMKTLESQLKSYHFPPKVIDQFVGKSAQFDWLGISGGFTLVYRSIPEPYRLKPVETEYFCMLGGEHPQVIFAANVLGQLGGEEYNEGASGLTKDSLVVLNKEYFPAPEEGKVTEFWVYAHTTCFNLDTNIK